MKMRNHVLDVGHFDLGGDRYVVGGGDDYGDLGLVGGFGALGCDLCDDLDPRNLDDSKNVHGDHHYENPLDPDVLVDVLDGHDHETLDHGFYHH